MYVCVCAGVTDAQWTEALAEASRNGQGWREASYATGAGLGCGGCRPLLAHSPSPVSLDLPVLDLLPAGT